MAPAGGCDSHLPTLTSPNLRKLADRSSVDKNQSICSYVHSQQAHLATYAVEGKSFVISWGSVMAETSESANKPPRDHEIGSGFGTPVLKPRNANPADEDLCTEGNQHDCTTNKATKEKANARSRSISSIDGKGNMRIHSVKVASTDTLPPSGARADNSRNLKTKPAASAYVGTALGEIDVEKEHRSRLAERRERRRSKKAIVDPNPDPLESGLSGGSDGERESTLRKDKKKDQKSKKGSGLSMPAGLALMHGFSATNIGANRLTLKPTRPAGVFSKGKASAKTNVKKSKRLTNPQLSCFSEKQFLSNTKPHITRAVAESDCMGEDVSDTSSKQNSAGSKRVKTHPVKILSSNRKRLRSKSTTTVSQDEHGPGKLPGHTSSPLKKRKERQESPVWDIELEDGRLPPGSASECSAPAQTSGDLQVSASLLLNTRASTSKWAAQEEQVQRYGDQEEDKKNRVSELQRSSSPSICPSHSASQVARCENGNPEQSAMFSKYFRTLKRTLPERPAVHSNSAPQMGYQESVVATISKYLTVSTAARNDASQWVARCQDDVRQVAQCQYTAMRSDTSQSLLPHSLELHSDTGGVNEKAVIEAELAERVLSHSSITPARSKTSIAYQEMQVQRFSPPPLPSPIVKVPADQLKTTVDLDLDSLPLSSSLGLMPGPLSPVSTGAVDTFLQNDIYQCDRSASVSLLHDPLEDGPMEDLLDPVDQRTVLWSTQALSLSNNAAVPLLLSNCSRYARSATTAGFPEDIDIKAFPDDVVPAFDDTSPREDEPYDDYVQPFADYVQPYDDYMTLEPLQPCHERSEVDTMYWNAVDGGGLRIPSSQCEEVEIVEGTPADFAIAYTYWDTVEDVQYAEAVGESTFDDCARPSDDLEGRYAHSSILEEDGESEASQALSVLGSLQRFSQGRALLMGMADVEVGLSYCSREGVSKVEEDVARGLVKHWLPQRF